jgi:hypothetical protein
MAALTGTVFASAARTATPTAVEIDTQRCKGIRLYINVTAASATPSVVFDIKTVDPVSDTKTILLSSAAITGTGHTLMVVYPGATAAANVAVSNVVGSKVQIVATHADADSITYSVGYALIP